MEKYCAWCNKKIGNQNKTTGSEIPKEKQIGTHGICADCYEDQMKEIDKIQEPAAMSKESFSEWLLRRDFDFRPTSAS
jgi:hypothetical protein